MAQEIATLGGGCFWCLEAVYDQLKGVSEVESAYAGGKLPDATNIKPEYQSSGTWKSQPTG